MSGPGPPRSRWYDGRVYAAVVDRALAGLHRSVAEHLPAGERVLDACCGTGGAALRFALAGRRVVGVDLSPDQIATARSRAGAAGIGPDRLRFEVGDVGRLKPPDEGPYDVAVTVLALHEMPAEARQQVVATLVAVAHRVVLVDFAAPMPLNAAGLVKRAAELVAGPGHFAAFRDFVRRGGLAPLVGAADARVEDDRTIGAGTLQVVTLGDGPRPV